MSLDINSFDFEALKAVTKEDPFAEKKYKTDDRFYKLQRNENDQGVAFLILATVLKCISRFAAFFSPIPSISVRAVLIAF